MAPPKRRRSTTSNAVAIRIDGAKEMRETLKNLGDRALLKELGAENKRIARFIVLAAQELAGSSANPSRQKRERIVAGNLLETNAASYVGIRLPGLVDVSDKRGPRPVGMGTEFGAYQNRRRLRKSTGGRNTIVRDDEDINAVIRRVEAQTITRDRYGGASTIKKKARTLGGEAVRVTGVMKGWNTFRPWRGNGTRAGYFLFPAIRRNRDKAVELYIAKIENIWSRRKAA